MSIVNIELKGDGTMIKRKGYKTFSEMVRYFEKLNKRYKKMGVSGEFTITLPIKGWLQHKH